MIYLIPRDSWIQVRPTTVIDCLIYFMWWWCCATSDAWSTRMWWRCCATSELGRDRWDAALATSDAWSTMANQSITGRRNHVNRDLAPSHSHCPTLWALVMTGSVGWRPLPSPSFPSHAVQWRIPCWWMRCVWRVCGQIGVLRLDLNAGCVWHMILNRRIIVCNASSPSTIQSR